MEIVSVRFQEKILKRIDSSISEHNYNSRTEFIREAVRDKLEQMRTEKLINEFMKFYGSAKKKTTYEDNRKTRETFSKELMKFIKTKYPSMTYIKIPADMYPNSVNNTEITTLGSRVLLLTTKDMDNETVYYLTKEICTYFPDFESVNSAFIEVTPDFGRFEQYSVRNISNCRQ